MKCTTHPKYEAKRKPQCDCLTCWIMWEAKQSKDEIPVEPQHGREPDKVKPHPNKAKRQDCADCLYPERSCSDCINRTTLKLIKPIIVKPLAQYLAEYLDAGEYQEIKAYMVTGDVGDLQEAVEQALDAYESTENVTIKIERVL